MGVVYLGTAKDGTQAAIKVLRPELADDQDFRLRFSREVAMLARVACARCVCSRPISSPPGRSWPQNMLMARRWPSMSASTVR